MIRPARPTLAEVLLADLSLTHGDFFSQITDARHVRKQCYLLWKMAVVRREKSGFNGRGVALTTASCLSPISRRRWRSSPALGSQTLLGSERERHNSSTSRLENGPLPTKARSRQRNPAAPKGRGSSESACLRQPTLQILLDALLCKKAGRIKVWPISRAVFATCTHEIGFGFFDPLTRRGFHGETCLSP